MPGQHGSKSESWGRTRRKCARSRSAAALRAAGMREDAGGASLRFAQASTPGRTRTCDPLLRRQMLYPAELRGRACRLSDNPTKFPIFSFMTQCRKRLGPSAARARITICL